jgi:hypothetical protein
MPKSNESINKDLDDLLNSHGFEVVAMNSAGEQVPVPEEADLFQFHFHKDGDDYGTVTVTIDGLQKMIVYYDDQIANSGNNESDDISWIFLVKQFKRFALNHQLAFELKDTDRLRTDMKRREHTKKLEESVKLEEGYYGNRKMSYSDDTPTVKMVIKHNKQLEETDQRFRHIERIFLETSDGERFQAPTNKPSRARMFARHIAEGGAYRDDRWSHLQEICEDLDALGGFVRATHRKREQFNESAQRMIGEATEKYQQLRETVKQLSTGRGYNKYFESYQPAIITETDDTLGDVFMHSTIDTRIERALPVLNKFGITYTTIAESDVFEQWADSILDEALDPMTDAQEEELIKLLGSSDLKVGPNGEVAIAALDDIINSDDLNDEIRAAAEQDSNNDAVAVIKSWMERQHNPRYDSILNKLDTGDEVERDSENTSPEKVKPKQPQPQQPTPQQPAGDLGALPPLPPLPPLAEESDFKRLLKLSGI